MQASKLIAHNTPNVTGGHNTLAQIKGQTKRLNVQYQAIVHLVNTATHEIKITTSDQNGFYRFKNLPKGQKYIVFARDPMSEFNAVISDNVVAK